jgi:hypothetical protein
MNRYTRSIFKLGSNPAFENKFETVKPAISFGRKRSDGDVSKLRRTLGRGRGYHLIYLSIA